MASLNKFIGIGRLGKDVESRQAGSSPVANFSIAISERFKDRQGQQQEKTEWLNIVAWGNLAEICKRYLKKGSLVMIEGKLTTRSWENNEGVKQYKTEIVASNMQMLDSRSEGGQQSQQGGYQNQPNPTYTQAPPEESDLPF